MVNPQKTPETLDIENTPVISNENISTENTDKKVVLKVNTKELEDGFHYMNTPNGNKFFVEMSNRKPSAVYITNKVGKVIRGISIFGNTLLEFSCSGSGCVCKGDDDCNDMFSTNVCGRFAICHW